jgi:hypothetical protein
MQSRDLGKLPDGQRSFPASHLGARCYVGRLLVPKT